MKVSQADQMREVVSHTYTDMTVAIKMLRRLRLPSAWRKLQQGYNRLGKALDVRSTTT